MLRYVFDTDHLTLFGFGHPPSGGGSPRSRRGRSASPRSRCRRYFEAGSRPSPGSCGGPRVYQAYASLTSSVQLVAPFPIVPFDRAAEQEYLQLQTLRLRVGTADERIAATALANRLVVVTRNRRDFAQVPGLALDDWSV